MLWFLQFSVAELKYVEAERETFSIWHYPKNGIGLQENKKLNGKSIQAGL